MSLRGLIKKTLKQRAVYWEYTGPDEFNRPTFKPAVVIKVRWEDRVTAFVDKQGRTQTSKAAVLVDRDILEGGALALLPVGTVTLPTLTNPLNPYDNPPLKAWEVQRFDKVPLINPKTEEDFYRLAYL